MRAGMRGLRGFCTAFAGDANSSFQWLKGRSFGGAAGRPKGTAKVLHFQRKCCISVFGAPDQSEKGAKKGENGGAAGAGFRADSGRKIGAEVGLFVVGDLSKVYRFAELSRKGTPQAWLPADAYEIRPISGCITELGLSREAGCGALYNSPEVA